MCVAAFPIAERPLLYRLPRETLEALVERIIEYLDATDGDPDEEDNGDALDGTGGEDDFADYLLPHMAAGCPVSDPAEEDIPDEYSYQFARQPKFGIDQTVTVDPMHIA